MGHSDVRYDVIWNDSVSNESWVLVRMSHGVLGTCKVVSQVRKKMERVRNRNT